MNWLYLLLGSDYFSNWFNEFHWYVVITPWAIISADINLFTSVNVVCFLANAPSDSCSGIMIASFVWSNATFSLFINLDANSVNYWLRLLGFWFIHFFGGSSIRWTLSHTYFGLRELNAFRRKEAFLDVIVFYNDFLHFVSSGGHS